MFNIIKLHDVTLVFIKKKKKNKDVAKTMKLES